MTDIERDSKTENTDAESGSEERKRKLDKFSKPNRNRDKKSM